MLFIGILWVYAMMPTSETYGANEDTNTFLTTSTYRDIYQTWVTQGFAHIPSQEIFSPETFYTTQPLEAYENQVVLKWEYESQFKINTFIHDEGLYLLRLRYVSQTTSIKPIQFRLFVNGELPYDEASRFKLKTLWSQNEIIQQDRFGNDIVPESYQVYQPIDFILEDNVGLYEDPLYVYLHEGINSLTFDLIDGEAYIFEVGFETLETLDSYMNPETYASSNQHVLIEGEDFTIKSDPSIRGGSHREPYVTPFSLMESRLNILDGQTFNRGRQSVYYDVTIETDGYYYITFKALQNASVNTSVFRDITINGEYPFVEAKGIEFTYNRTFQHRTLGNETYDFKFYLPAGHHQIGIHTNISMYQNLYLNTLEIMSNINALTLDIQKITGNQLDENRDWNITDYLPDLVSTLQNLTFDIKALYDDWTSIHSEQTSPTTTALKLSYERMQKLLEDPNELPRNLNDLSIGSGSVLALIGTILPQLIESPLSIDSIYIHEDIDDLPSLRAPFFTRLWVNIQRFFLSFFSDQYNDEASDDELEVWVNRGRAYVDLMQQMADTLYTPETNQKVRISIMPDENKLILANAADAQPDIAVGIAAWRPFEFSIRGSLHDLRTFDDFYDVASRFESGSFTGLIYQEGVYALPDTQNFQLLFYRKDVLSNLDLDVPNTWNDVIEMLPELQRFGLNFYIPLANNAAFKSFDTTFPWIVQHGGSLYSENGFSVAYDDPKTLEAIKTMTDLFKIYSLPVEVGSFYQRFRYGDLPIGVGDFGMYVQLLNAAPEISGLWDIALIPGVYNETTDTINRSFVGASTVNVIFEASTLKDEAWDFLNWWSDTETQVIYSERLITTYGPEFLWNTANKEAFENMSWDRNHQSIILEQWQYVYDPIKVPGSYMVERELSNIWNRVVYDGVNIRTAVEDATVIVDREITRKMTEFGYLNTDGVIIKNYFIPTDTTIIDWRIEHDNTRR